jgi:alkylation response protein AidB-like acyl-CoA dehydrogenase
VENFFLDNEDIQFHFKHLDLERVVELKEDNYGEKNLYAHAPNDYADAKDNYKKVLSIIGEISGEALAPLAEDIDLEGVKLKDGEVVYAKGTAEVMDLFAKADLMGFGLPRKYGGLNFPTTALSIAAEISSRADASFLNFGLQQDIGETINKFGSEEQKRKCLPRLASGEVGSAMILTEPDAGSDLQAVNLKAHIGKDGKWYLNGVKRFITNGNGKIALVLARSEDGVQGARGLSLFLYEREKGLKIRRLEDKLGIHGSPTCELQFTDAPAVLLGERKRGLTKYTMWLMNSARLGIAAQALGIAEAAYREADKYTSEREQFGGPIRKIIPVIEMLTEMRIAIEAGRTLLYETAMIVDIKEGLEHAAEKYPERAKDLKAEIKKYTRLAGLYTPIVKAYNTEMVNKVTYDALQLHGGTGYMKDFPVERHYRDARITNIYEGTTQLQVVAAIGGITSGVAMGALDEYEQENYSHASVLHGKVVKAKNELERVIAFVKGVENSDFITFHSRRLVEMTTDLTVSYLLLRDSARSKRKMKVAEAFIESMIYRIDEKTQFILSGTSMVLKNHEEIIG